MAKVTLTPARRRHVPEVAASVRDADAAEVLASHGCSLEVALLDSLQRSEIARLMWIGDEIAAMFGVISSADAIDRVWMVTTTVVDQHRLAFWRESKAIVQALRTLYPHRLGQYVDARHIRGVEYLRRLGFTVGDAVPYGAAQLPFHPIWLEG